jgi:Uma2 family endonuclease
MALTAAQFVELMPDGRLLESDEPEMESSLHYLQLMLLVSCLNRIWGDRNDYFIGANLTIYYSRQQIKTRDFRGPDLFLVKGVENLPRRSWVIWEEEGRYPDLIIELLSDSTAQVDRTTKKALYQNQFHTQEYFWFSPETLEFEGFRLQGQTYGAIAPTDEGYRWSEELDLYLGIYEGQLRYFDANRQMVLTPSEAELFEQQRTSLERQRADQAQQAALQAQQAVLQEQQRADQAQQVALQAQQAALQEKQRADALAERLRAAGLDPEA